MLTNAPAAHKPPKSQGEAPPLDTYRAVAPKGSALRGFGLRVVASLANTWALGWFVKRQMLGQSGLSALRAIDVGNTPRMGAPVFAQPAEPASEVDPLPGSAAADLHRRYLAGHSPVDEARRFLAAAKVDDHNAFVAIDDADVLAQAEASAARYAKGQPKSPLDGVLIAVKDQIDVAGYVTGVGTASFDETASADAAIVARLRDAGAIIVGKTNMHELGLGVTGVNPHTGAVKNAHDPSRIGGGSSGGSAVAAALGLVPITIGSDAGGSTRIPAALNGVVGLKPTYGAWSTDGVFGVAPSLTQPGPIAQHAEDVAMAFTAVTGRPVRHLEDRDLRGIRIGIDESWNAHATPEMVEATERAIAHYRSLGAEIVPIQMRGLNEAGLTQMAQYVVELEKTLDGELPEGSSAEAKLSLALGSALSEKDRAHIEQLRQRISDHTHETFENVDVVLSPATGMTAPQIQKSALSDGESDLATLQALNRFATLANLTGVPAITFPAPGGESSDGTGVQLMAAPHEDALLIRLANAAGSAEPAPPDPKADV